MLHKVYLGVIALLVLTTLSGCATWKHPYKGESDFYRDKLSCEKQAAQIYPTIIVNQLNPGYQSPSTTNCRRLNDDRNSPVVCNTTPGMYLPPSYSQSDVNGARREDAVNSCLKAGGWRLEY
ncbi:hypothetical protein [Glaciimonas immobilis]|uniref:Putative lipoprotein n=1 Tax=Glaciimonas immobilis TaxID=728004 RepID=A0A840RQM6_9BURK|nr:hypothetical protein [Glaciimonas immobilis]KAF3999308.1 hypothetical protein HAV38_05095 [Glaciimonas immobilis]MBB5198789.1 putative lipoprotein [Glaciimonas immobilis]